MQRNATLTVAGVSEPSSTVALGAGDAQGRRAGARFRRRPAGPRRMCGLLPAAPDISSWAAQPLLALLLPARRNTPTSPNARSHRCSCCCCCCCCVPYALAPQTCGSAATTSKSGTSAGSCCGPRPTGLATAASCSGSTSRCAALRRVSPLACRRSHRSVAVPRCAAQGDKKAKGSVKLIPGSFNLQCHDGKGKGDRDFPLTVLIEVPNRDPVRGTRSAQRPSFGPRRSLWSESAVGFSVLMAGAGSTTAAGASGH